MTAKFIGFVKKHPVFFVCMLIYFICPLALNLLFLFPLIPTGDQLGNPEWLAFWGSYLGSGLGIFATYISFRMTYDQTEQQYKNAEKEREEERRLQILPYINVVQKGAPKKDSPDLIDIWISGSSELQRMPCYIDIQNIGLGNAVNVEIQYGTFELKPKNLPNLPVGEVFSIKLSSVLVSKEEFETQIVFHFSDLQSKRYTQSVKIYLRKSVFREKEKYIYRMETNAPQLLQSDPS